jgi:hypothetical protein
MRLTHRLPSLRFEALKPMVWYVALTLGLFALTSFSANERVLNWMLYFTAAGVINFILAYWWLLIRQPDRLQSENYMRHLLGDKRKGRGSIEDRPRAVLNPANQATPH